MVKIGGKQTIVDLFLENVDLVPEKTFVRFEGADISYGDMGRASEQMAKSLDEAGIGHASRVALSIGNRPAFLVGFLGVLRCGATVIPLNTQYKPDEARYALEHAGCQAVITEVALSPIINAACALLEQDIAVLVAADNDETSFVSSVAADRHDQQPGRQLKPKPEDLAGIFYTSGTTARPKGVMISHENMMYSAEVTIKSLALGADDLPLLAFPLFHVNSLFYGVLTAIVLQGTIGLVRGFSVSRYWQDAVRTGATWTPGITGPLAQLLLDQKDTEPASSHNMRFAVGGGFMSVVQIQEFEQRFGVTLLQGWSMTETVSLGTLHPVSRSTPISSVTGIGYPTLGQEVRLITADGREADAGEPGEILYRTPSMFGGYLNDEKATRETFTTDGWLRTGDVACMDEKGYMSFIDRKQEMIKTKGENVAAAEVERALNEHPGVLESAAIGVADSDGIWGEKIEAYVVRAVELDNEVEEDELKQWVERRLADFKVPATIHFIDQLPKTPLGKLQRQKLRQQ
jgi:crotonobetaine/carnitine-CoA ligase